MSAERPVPRGDKKNQFVQRSEERKQILQDALRSRAEIRIPKEEEDRGGLGSAPARALTAGTPGRRVLRDLEKIAVNRGDAAHKSGEENRLRQLQGIRSGREPNKRKRPERSVTVRNLEAAKLPQTRVHAMNKRAMKAPK
ncbi:hypothetical protein NDU88_004848 [Pleurodeles waltl]|uniref:Uncharacterized protein n=1 Tax=Pleurodeles waltl TaxID=8319 RepID=A0AAV7KZI8_PLEWA|nr:hypothetical protein NDU88_004848 [Pleurodeles waltl]